MDEDSTSTSTSFARTAAALASATFGASPRAFPVKVLLLLLQASSSAEAMPIELACELHRRICLLTESGSVAPSLRDRELRPMLAMLESRMGVQDALSTRRSRKRSREAMGATSVTTDAAMTATAIATTVAQSLPAATATAVPFSESERWRRQRLFYEAQGVGAWHSFHVPCRISSNSLCAAQLGSLALAFFADAAATARATPRALAGRRCLSGWDELTVVELGAGHGLLSYQLALWFLDQLGPGGDAEEESDDANDDDNGEGGAGGATARPAAGKLSGIVARPRRVRVIVTDFNEELLRSRMAEAPFRRLVDAGVLDFAVLDGSDNHHRDDHRTFDDSADQDASRLIQLLCSQRPLAPGPTFAVAQYLVDSLPCDVFLHDRRPPSPLGATRLWEALEETTSEDDSSGAHPQATRASSATRRSKRRSIIFRPALAEDTPSHHCLPASSATSSSSSFSAPPPSSSSSSSLAAAAATAAAASSPSLSASQRRESILRAIKALGETGSMDKAGDSSGIQETRTSPLLRLVPFGLEAILQRLRRQAAGAFPFALAVGDSPATSDDEHANDLLKLLRSATPAQVHQHRVVTGPSRGLGGLVPEITPTKDALALPVDFDVVTELFRHSRGGDDKGSAAPEGRAVTRLQQSPLLLSPFATLVLADGGSGGGGGDDDGDDDGGGNGMAGKDSHGAKGSARWPKLCRAFSERFGAANTSSMEDLRSLVVALSPSECETRGGTSGGDGDGVSLAGLLNLLEDSFAFDFGFFFACRWLLVAKSRRQGGTFQTTTTTAAAVAAGVAVGTAVVAAAAVAAERLRILRVALECVSRCDASIGLSLRHRAKTRLEVLRFFYAAGCAWGDAGDAPLAGLAFRTVALLHGSSGEQGAQRRASETLPAAGGEGGAGGGGGVVRLARLCRLRLPPLEEATPACLAQEAALVARLPGASAADLEAALSRLEAPNKLGHKSVRREHRRLRRRLQAAKNAP